MMDIKEAALQKAIAFLKASGADYIVTLGDEVYQSENPAAPVAPVTHAATRKPRKRMHYFDRDTDYLRRIRAMKPTEVVRFYRKDYPVLATDVAWGSFKPSVHSATRSEFGQGNFLYRQADDDSYVEVMRAV